MIQNKKRSLVEQIRKLAAPPPDPPAGYMPPAPTRKYEPYGPPALTAPGATPTGARSGTRYANPKIHDMQQELINLAQAVTSQLNLKDLTSDDPRKQQEAAGRDSFGSFLTKHYMRTSDVPGVEFDPNAQKTEMSQKSPSQPTRLSVVMDTMKRIGSPKPGEQFADGAWGRRTNAGLHNAYAFAQSLLKLAKDFRLTITSYNDTDLRAFKTMIPNEVSDFSNEKKTKAAPYITKHLQAIEKLYNEIKGGVLEKPEFRAYIEGDKPYATYQKAGLTLTPEQITGMKQTFQTGFSIPVDQQGKHAQITVDDLLSLDKLKTWTQKNAPGQDPYNVLTMVSDQLSRKQGA